MKIEDVAIESLEALLEKVREVNSVEELNRRKTAWSLRGSFTTRRRRPSVQSFRQSAA